MRLARYLPHTASRRLGATIGRVAHRLDPAARRRAHANLRLAFPDLEAGHIARLASDAAAHRLAARFDVASACRFEARAFCRRLTLEGWNHLEEAERQGRGIFVLGAPFGAWQITMLAIALYRGPVQAVGSWHKDSAFRPLAASFGSPDLRLFSESTNARSPQSGERFGFLVDPSIRSEQAVSLPFLSQMIRETTQIASASIASGAAIVPIFGRFRSKGRWIVEVHEPISPSVTDVETLTARYLKVIEEVVRHRPEQWFGWWA